MTGDCTDSNICPVEGGFISYQPSIPGNSVLLAGYAVTLPVAIVLGYRFHTLGFTVNLSTGVILEILGFAGRLLLNGRRESQAFFSLYLLGTILGPCLLASAIFTVLPHLLLIYGNDFSPLSSGHAGLVFIALVVLSIVLEIVGVAFSVFGLDGKVVVSSTRVLLAGLAVQAGTLLLFVALYVWFIFRVKNSAASIDPRHGDVYRSAKFKRFLIALQSAATLLFISTIVRIVEVGQGFGEAAAQSEAVTTVIYGALPLVACILLTALHPGHAFGPSWYKTAPRYVSRLASVEGGREPNSTPTLRERRLESNPHARFSVRKVAPMPLSASSQNPYELFPSTISPGHPSPASNGYPSPGSTGYPSPMRASYNSRSPRRFSYISRSPGTSPKHSPRKPPERHLVDDDDLW
ncbi:hypothetical protein jhhlp_006108 [Lomentospora prolificans]|uniref:Sphingoid long-chain base transporter RSB1 n=1 Tax=Lomentospora prolificans TaxID=41688 RepID=A0A2N3N511_9PEZI|nr:hypothetical protein jhhlp_006108 [Lomentospora prolificans]